MAKGKVRLVWQSLVHKLVTPGADHTLCGKYIGTMKPYQQIDLGAADCPDCKRKSKQQSGTT